jgi:NAD(P)-dependent dehydrogenase (short-subunit alcohol dehydrogenase family)
MTTTKSVAIVTGASQGIGRATAIRLARDFSVMVGAGPQPNSGGSNQEISRAGWHHSLWQVGGGRRSDELSRIAGGKVDDSRFYTNGQWRVQGYLEGKGESNGASGTKLSR